MRKKQPVVKASDVLLACADVMVGAPEMHCKDVFAKDIRGQTLSPSGGMDGAVSFCARGLIYQGVADLTGKMPDVDGRDIKDGDIAQQCHYYANLSTPDGNYIASFNNRLSTTPEMLAKVFEKAAALAIAEGK